MRPLVRAVLAASPLVVAGFLCAPLGAQSRPKRRVVLLAHADDETAGAPVLARCAREGVRVYMVIATDGSGGSGSQAYLQRSDSGPVGQALVKARAEEAHCAAAALGTQEPVLLSFPDGTLGDYPGDRTLLSRLMDSIAKQIERLRPDAVMTWGPDGGTGHPGHRLVSDIATQLQRPGVAGMPERLVYMYLPADMFRLANPQRGEPHMRSACGTVRSRSSLAHKRRAGTTCFARKLFALSPTLLQQSRGIRQTVGDRAGVAECDTELARLVAHA
jgi:LmbE family N-acetylglucosaminyl deacetylase